MSNKTVLQRVEDTEATLKSLSASFDAFVGQVRNTIAGQMEALQALVSVLKDNDPDFDTKVGKRVDQQRLERLQQKADQEATQVKTLVENGVLVPTDKVTENTVVVGKVYLSDGSIVPPGRTQFEVSRLDEETRTNLIGKGVGEMFEAKSGEKLEVLEVYTIHLQEPEAPTPSENKEV